MKSLILLHSTSQSLRAAFFRLGSSPVPRREIAYEKTLWFGFDSSNKENRRNSIRRFRYLTGLHETVYFECSRRLEILSVLYFNIIFAEDPSNGIVSHLEYPTSITLIILAFGKR